MDPQRRRRGAAPPRLPPTPAKTRRYWLENFYRVNERAVRGWDTLPEAWVIPADQANASGLAYVLRILTMGDVEVHRAQAPFSAAGRSLAAGDDE